ncbi:MAG: hypothetical protein ABSA47_12660 [Verrucomicrobiota bacterium]|jgi:hypothetical protein
MDSDIEARNKLMDEVGREFLSSFWKARILRHVGEKLDEMTMFRQTIPPPAPDATP